MSISSFETLARAATVQPVSEDGQVYHRLYRMAEHLSGMIHAGEFENCPSYVIAELELLPVSILDAADEVVTIIAERPRVPRRVVWALGAAVSASMFSGMLVMGFGQFRLGLADLIFGAVLFVWASQERA